MGIKYSYVRPTTQSGSLVGPRAERRGARAPRQIEDFLWLRCRCRQNLCHAGSRAREHAAGVDLVVGYVEPHGRPETEGLLEGMEVLPSLQVPYRGVTLREFDLDAALIRRPKLILVDELAHTNAEGLRHAKRWQDIEELLEVGIDVWSTLNVQHLESLNDVVAQITGVVVRETLPDAVLEKVDELELIDITPQELIERLRAGKVYISLQAEEALEHFFQRTNLIALRELSLRQAANRLRRDVDAARHDRGDLEPWATNERLLVCVSASPTSAKLIRTAKRMAAAFGAEWLAVAVQTRGAGRNRRPYAKKSLNIYGSRSNSERRPTFWSARKSPRRSWIMPSPEM